MGWASTGATLAVMTVWALRDAARMEAILGAARIIRNISANPDSERLQRSGLWDLRDQDSKHSASRQSYRDQAYYE